MTVKWFGHWKPACISSSVPLTTEVLIVAAFAWLATNWHIITPLLAVNVEPLGICDSLLEPKKDSQLGSWKAVNLRLC